MNEMMRKSKGVRSEREPEEQNKKSLGDSRPSESRKAYYALYTTVCPAASPAILLLRITITILDCIHCLVLAYRVNLWFLLQHSSASLLAAMYCKINWIGSHHGSAPSWCSAWTVEDFDRSLHRLWILFYLHIPMRNLYCN